MRERHKVASEEGGGEGRRGDSSQVRRKTEHAMVKINGKFHGLDNLVTPASSTESQRGPYPSEPRRSARQVAAGGGSEGGP